MPGDYNLACIISRVPCRSFSLLLVAVLSLLSCTGETLNAPTGRPSLWVYRFEPPAFIEYSESFAILGEIPFSIPPHCELFNVVAAPQGPGLAIELSCPNGQTVLIMDTASGSVRQPVQDSDSHFLAWTFDGREAYLRIDSLGSPRVVRRGTGSLLSVLPVTEFTYDLAASPDGDPLTFAFSRGMGHGSELWLAKADGEPLRLLYADPLHYLSFARFSPDGDRIALIKIPDTGTPFTVGELWVLDTSGSNARRLAAADAGHGYAANWSPDGQQIAFVVRENPTDPRADRSSQALISNLYRVHVQTGELEQATYYDEGQTETPFWSPDGSSLIFTRTVDDRMEVNLADLATGEIRPLLPGPACCPAWLQK